MQQSETLALELTDEDFEFFKNEIFRIAGISLTAAKRDLVQSRLRSRVLELRLASFAAYRERLLHLDSTDPEWQNFTNLLTTNKTDWFREPKHFEFLSKRLLPYWKKTQKQHIKIWCAASSTGEEPYSLALQLHSELLPLGITFQILATDIDTDVLAKASNGVYPKEHLSQIAEKYHSMGFDSGTKEIANWVRVKREIKERVEFRHFNITSARYPWLDEFDLIFCRNVFIYFQQETIRQVVENAFQAAKQDACLVIAHAESLQNVRTSWQYVSPSIYSRAKKAPW